MASILLHCPLNISRSLNQLMADFCQTWSVSHRHHHHRFRPDIPPEKHPHHLAPGRALPHAPGDGFQPQAPEAMLEIGDFLMSPAVQDYLGLQRFVPAAQDAALPPLVAENHCDLCWKGWAAFLSALGESHA